jgi:hypothetical protein
LTGVKDVRVIINRAGVIVNSTKSAEVGLEAGEVRGGVSVGGAVALEDCLKVRIDGFGPPVSGAEVGEYTVARL